MKHLVGTWHLAEWDCTIDGHYHSHPFGEEAQGRITYTEDGYMSAILMRAQRPHFARPNLVTGTDAEKLAAISGYVSYAGTYRVEGEQVIHSVQFSLLPNWIGTDLVRRISWTQDDPPQLVLTTIPEITRSDKAVINRLRWQQLTTTT